MPPNAPTLPPRALGVPTASLAVVASMIGTGVFTTTGLLVRDVGSPAAVLVQWALYGGIALCGALSYAELSAAIARNGGEYALLSRIYHPAVGFAAGLVSLVVGFAAPIAACAIAFGEYLHALLPAIPVRPAALALVVLSFAMHALHLGLGARLQNALTALKLALVVAFAVAGFVALGIAGAPGWSAAPRVPLGAALVSAPFAAGLVLVSFAYSGWNAVAYLAGEVRDPGRTIPRAVLLGTGVVAALYVALNAVFLGAVPAARLEGVVEIAHVAATALFGPRAADAVSIVVALGLVSTVGALVMTGARAGEAMGHDHPRLALLARRARHDAPTIAVGVQTGLAAVLVLLAQFDALLVWTGLTLTAFAALTVAGVIVLRFTEPGLERPFRVPLYPVVPLVFVAFSAWSALSSVLERPLTSLASAGTIGAALLLYALLRR